MDELGATNMRRRSRSKTPFVADVGDHGQAVKKSPTVATVVEEPTTPANVRTSARTTRKTIVSVETSSVRTVKSGTATTVANNSSNGNGSGSGEQNFSTNTSSKEINQNELNSMFEENSRMHLRTSTPIQATTAAASAAIAAAAIAAGSARRTIVTAALSGDGNDHEPYREYRDAGEYWNKYPKTDYTYSRLSPHRRELAPGVVAMPNMSRRSLDHHQERVDNMAKNAPGNESFIRKRYQSNKYKTSDYRRIDYDSQDETDESNNRTVRWWHISEWRLVRWLTTIITTLWTSCTGVFTSRQTTDEHSNYYTQQLHHQQQEQGWFRKCVSVVTNAFLKVFRYLYVIISTVLFLDTWLLRSSTTANNPNKKRFLILMLILLPLLLLAAWQLHTDAERTAFVAPIARLSLAGGLPLFSLSAATRPALDLTGIFSDFSFGLLPAWSSSTSATSAAGQSNEATMSEEQYRNLLAHLNSYVKTYVNEQIAADKSSPSVEPQSLSAQSIATITAMITERLTNTPPSTQPNPTATVPSIDSIVAQVLLSDRFTGLSAANVQLASATANNDRLIGDQRLLIEALQLEIEQIRAKYALNENAQQNVDQSIRLLNAHRETIDAQFRAFQQTNAEQLSKLQLELNGRLEEMDSTRFVAIDARIKLVLMDAFGYRSVDGTEPDLDSLKAWIHSVFVAKSALEARLLELAVGRDQFVREEIERLSGVLMKQITDRIRAETIILLEKQRTDVLQESRAEILHTNRIAELSEDNVRRIVAEALRVYDADKTGLVDYALESAGGEIVSTRCTETYHTKSAQISIFGIPLWYPTNTPRTVISPAVQPGLCWAFQGFPGFLVLKLNAYIYVTGFTMEHIPRSISPNGNIDSAPKTFTVWGLEHTDDHHPLQFGTYEFRENDTNLQYFRVDEANRQRLHNIVELRIESNHGNANYTCLYRFRVHGTTGS